jgi:N-acetylneuraminate lyase
MQTFKGIWPALVTPFTAENTVSAPVMQSLVDYLLGKGVDGFYVCGSTGEGVLMSVEERKSATETVLRQVDGRVPVIVHVGCMALQDALHLAQHARDSGAAGIASIIPPLYDTLDSLFAYYEALATSVPELPLLTYLLYPNIDSLALLRRLAALPNFAGAKYTGPNMHELRRIIDLGEHRWTVFSGMDEQCVYAAMMGSSGAIGSTLNFMPGVYREIRRHVTDCDFAGAQELQLRANAVTAVMFDIGFWGALKEVMRMLGFECGHPRLPHLPIDEQQAQTLRRELEKTAFSTLTHM